MGFKGMTGFGIGEVEDKTCHVKAELRSWNSKSLDISVKGDIFLPEWESLIRKEIIDFGVKRGHIRAQFYLRIKSPKYNVSINKTLLKELILETEEIGMNLSVSLSDLFSVPDLVSVEMQHNKRMWKLIRQALHKALVLLDKERLKEGKAMQLIILQQIAEIERAFSKIEQKVNSLDKRGFFDEFQTKGKDIFEEVKRLKMNIDLFKKTQNSNRAKGKQLDFISQEIMREANTFLAKVIDAKLSKQALKIKVCADRIREVVQNVE